MSHQSSYIKPNRYLILKYLNFVLQYVLFRFVFQLVIWLYEPSVHIIEFLSQHVSTVFSCVLNMHGCLVLCVSVVSLVRLCVSLVRGSTFMLSAVCLPENLVKWPWNRSLYLFSSDHPTDFVKSVKSQRTFWILQLQVIDQIRCKNSLNLLNCISNKWYSWVQYDS